jgi:lipopolysaccharide biosynthesis protein
MAYKLKSRRDVTRHPVLKASITRGEFERTLWLINGQNAEYVLLPRFGGSPIAIESDDLTVERLSPGQSLYQRLRSAMTFRRKKFLDYGAFRLLFDGPKTTRILLVRTNRLLTRLQTRPDSLAIRRYPALLIGWGGAGAPLPACAARQKPALRIAIVVHFFYPETWPELAEVLRHLPYDYDLFVTTVPERADMAAGIRDAFPSAQVRIVENRGRDVRPFLLLLEEGALAPYDIVCKIHGKRSIANDPSGNIGDIFRRRALFDMLVAPGRMQRIIDRFRADPALGMLGSRKFHLNSPRDRNIFWRVNFADMSRLIGELGGDTALIAPDFFEGTMFWARPAALEALARLKTSEGFAAERGASDGALEHTIERIFAVAAKLSSYHIDDIDGLSGG